MPVRGCAANDEFFFLRLLGMRGCSGFLVVYLGNPPSEWYPRNYTTEDKKSYQRKIMSMFQREGLQTISASRKSQRGGGVAIVADSQVIDIKDLDVIVPYNLEVKWAIGRPKSGAIKRIILPTKGKKEN